MRTTKDVFEELKLAMQNHASHEDIIYLLKELIVRVETDAFFAGVK